MNFGFAVIYNLDAHLAYAQLHFQSDHDGFDVKGEAVRFDERENLSGAIAAKRLEAALGIGEAKACEKIEHLDVRL